MEGTWPSFVSGEVETVETSTVLCVWKEEARRQELMGSFLAMV